MGCCENRDEVLERERMRYPQLENMSFSAEKLEKSSSQDPPIANGNTHTMNAMQAIISEDSLRQYIEWCRSHKNWSEMVSFITDFTSITESNSYVELFSPPKTIAALVLVYLDLELKQEHVLIVKAIEMVIFEVFLLLEKGSLDFIYNSIILLSDFAEYASEVTVRKLIKHGLFKIIFKFLNVDIEKYILRTSYFILKGRDYLKQVFFDSGGLALIKFTAKEISRKNLGTIGELLNLIEVLTFSVESQIDVYSFHMLNEGKIYEALANGINYTFPDEVKKKLSLILEEFKNYI